jgi:hypothetical protein
VGKTAMISGQNMLGLDRWGAWRIELIQAAFKARQHQESPFAVPTLARHLADVTATPLDPTLNLFGVFQQRGVHPTFPNGSRLSL